MTSIIDVAKRANVSITTVSRVLSGSSHPVSDEKRARVLEAAKVLNYSPSALAKALVTGDTNIVGVIIGDATDPYFATIVRGVEDVARDYGYLAIVCNSDRTPSIELQYLNTLNDYRVDGIIFAGGGLIEEEYLEEVGQVLETFCARGAVCISLGKHLFPSFPVLVDNRQVVIDAVDYLFSLGHTQIAYISGPRLLTTTEVRLEGFISAVEEHGQALNPGYIFDGDYTYEGGLEVARRIAMMSDKPTAVMASNDLMAIGCLVGLKAQGYKIPEDISIVGIDDIDSARFVDPPLTTVELPLYDLGKIGMESLIKLRLAEMSDIAGIILPHKLVVRKSAGPPRVKIVSQKSDKNGN
jgi:LacI family transcriptional regulator